MYNTGYTSTSNNGNEIGQLSMFVGLTDNTIERNKVNKLLSESKKHAVLDTGCSSIVCGINLFNYYMDDLSNYDRSKISEENSSKTFTFGNGLGAASMKSLKGKSSVLRSEIITDVVDCDFLLLQSKDAMERAKWYCGLVMTIYL